MLFIREITIHSDEKIDLWRSGYHSTIHDSKTIETLNIEKKTANYLQLFYLHFSTTVDMINEGTHTQYTHTYAHMRARSKSK